MEPESILPAMPDSEMNLPVGASSDLKASEAPATERGAQPPIEPSKASSYAARRASANRARGRLNNHKHNGKDCCKPNFFNQQKNPLDLLEGDFLGVESGPAVRNIPATESVLGVESAEAGLF
jgi:hypothetical protein